MKIRLKKPAKRTHEDIINDNWLKIHMTSHKIVKSENELEISNMRAEVKSLLGKIKKLEKTKK